MFIEVPALSFFVRSIRFVLFAKVVDQSIYISLHFRRQYAARDGSFHVIVRPKPVEQLENVVKSEHVVGVIVVVQIIMPLQRVPVGGPVCSHHPKLDQHSYQSF